MYISFNENDSLRERIVDELVKQMYEFKISYRYDDVRELANMIRDLFYCGFDWQPTKYLSISNMLGMMKCALTLAVERERYQNVVELAEYIQKLQDLELA